MEDLEGQVSYMCPVGIVVVLVGSQYGGRLIWLVVFIWRTLMLMFGHLVTIVVSRVRPTSFDSLRLKCILEETTLD